MMNKTRNFLRFRKTAALTLGCMIGTFALSGAAVSFAMEAETGSAAESTTTDTVIGTENAQNFAFVDAGIDPAAADYVSSKYDYDDGQFLYDVEFTADGVEYEYHVGAYDGSILKKSAEYEALKASLSAAGSSADSSVSISLDEAKEIAFADALLTEEEIELVTFIKEESDYDDGISVYDIEFCTDEKKYEYEIAVLSGDILSISEEMLQTSGTGSSTVSGTGSDNKTANTNSGSDGAGNSYISVDEAKAIALERAGLSAADVTFKKAKLDREDGIMVYEIEFYQGKTEYECEINAVTGEIRDFEIDD